MCNHEHTEGELRSLTADDIEALYRLEVASFEKPWSKTMLSGEFQNEAAHYYGVECDGCLVAYLGVWFVCDEGQITSIAVHPSWRRKGLAGRLLKHLCRLAPQQGLTFLTLEVREHNSAAIRLYQKNGFQLVGRRKGYYENKEDALLMTLALATQEGEKTD